MKIFFDTEFTGLHKDTTLISLGMIDENGRTFYAEFSDYDESQVDGWIKENVIDHLKFNDYYSKFVVDGDCTKMKGPKNYVRDCLLIWLTEYDNVQLVSDVCHYDMVLFIDLFGGAFDLPSKISPVCYDINQDIAFLYNVTDREAFDMSREDIIEEDYRTQKRLTGEEPKRIEGDKHNALYDAKVIKFIHSLIVK